MRTAIVLGATGLVGTELTGQLLRDPDYKKVVTLGRRAIATEGDKHIHHQVNFEEREDWTNLVVGDVFFSAMGTTLKTAGSEGAQWRVDYEYQLWGLQAAEQNGVGAALLVSSTGAHRNSPFFYPRMKGMLDEQALNLKIPSVTILRPGMLDGDRKEERPGERVGLLVGRLVPKWKMLAKARSFPVEVVSRAARVGAHMPAGARIWEASDVLEYGE